MAAPRVYTDWVAVDRQKARVAAARARVRTDREKAERHIERVALANGARAIHAHMPDAELRHLAERRADMLTDRVNAIAEPMTPEAMREWINAQLPALSGRAFPDFAEGAPLAVQLAGMLRRVQCPLWWRRQLRREVVRLREVEGMLAGEVCKRARQPYCTDDTVRRRAERCASNAAMLAATKIEDAAGEIITLAQAVAASTANKAIRRGELMTRIRGCEEWATAAGMVGIFTTNTCPSRFHAQTMHRGANPKHDGSTPRDGQRWLCDTWARTRAALQRARVRFFGFRVAEPHHDGCPHWHMLLWVDAAQLERLRATMRRYWLGAPRWLHIAHRAKPGGVRPELFGDLLRTAGDDGPDHGADRFETGAHEHRFKAVDIDPARGGAVGYVAKYIAKNIDDVGALEAQAHTDEHAGEQAELFDASARRVDAWASAWGIRQFQAIGQPPVTVWRELRRVGAQAVAGGSDAIKAAHAAVNRAGERRADWRAYLAAQGGAMTGRAYRVRIVADAQQREGRYGPTEVARPLGVEDTLRPGEWVLSDRREWRAAGTWSGSDRERTNVLREVVRGQAPQASCPPRTRVNNCTHRPSIRALMRSMQERNSPPQDAEWQPTTPEKAPPWHTARTHFAAAWKAC